MYECTHVCILKFFDVHILSCSHAFRYNIWMVYFMFYIFLASLLGKIIKSIMRIAEVVISTNETSLPMQMCDSTS